MDFGTCWPKGALREYVEVYRVRWYLTRYILTSARAHEYQYTCTYGVRSLLMDLTKPISLRSMSIGVSTTFSSAHILPHTSHCARVPLRTTCHSPRTTQYVRIAYYQQHTSSSLHALHSQSNKYLPLRSSRLRALTPASAPPTYAMLTSSPASMSRSACTV